MKKTCLKFNFFLTLLSSNVCFYSCSDSLSDISNELEQEVIIQEQTPLGEELNAQYQSNWEQYMGDIDPNQNWSMAKNVKAHIQLNDFSIGNKIAKFYTTAPTNPQCRILNEMIINGKGSVSFDIEKGLDEVFVRIEDTKGNLIVNRYFSINKNNEVFVSNLNIGSRSGGTIPTKGETLNLDSKYGKFYKLNGIDTIRDETTRWRIGDYVSLFANYENPSRENGLFAERTNNRDKWIDQIGNIQNGVIYTTNSEGPVSLTYLFGAGWNWNVLGYFYYFDGNDNAATAQNIKNAERYILIEDGRPQCNLNWAVKPTVAFKNKDGNDIFYNNNWETINDTIAPYRVARMTLGNMRNYNEHLRDIVVGTKYRLTYFGPDGKSTPTYTFPQNCHIVFFYMSFKGEMQYENANYSPSPLPNATPEKLWYSVPSLTREVHTNYEEDKNIVFGNRYTATNEQTYLSVTYKYGNEIIYGIEDQPQPNNPSNPKDYDYDMNDILFKVEGDLAIGDTPDFDPDPIYYSWIVACEDLGGTFDTDFNDMVFRLRYSKTFEGTTAKSKLEVTPLAAGGILPIRLYYNGHNIGGDGDPEFHTLINPNVKILYNSNDTIYYEVLHADVMRNEGTAQKYTIPIDNNFSIANNDFIENFSIKVNTDESTSYFINNEGIKEGKAPRMLFLLEDWRWPKEQESIVNAYPDFNSWVEEHSNFNWIKNYQNEKIVAEPTN